ncbi:MAG: flagellar hook-basal body complex protein [Pedobacter sp.]
MSLTSAMFTGVSGLLANAEGMSVIGNNLSNVNTVGFKSGRMLFSDMLSANIGNASQVGRGTQIQTVDNIFSQSSFETTESVTDLAIQGNSFFAVKDPNALAPVNQNRAMLTRAGAFRLDNELYLVNSDGYQVLDTQGNPIKFNDNAAGIVAANTALITATTAAAATAYATAATAIQTEATTQVTDATAFVAAVAAVPGTAAEIAAANAILDAATTAKTAADAAVATPNATNSALAQTAFNELNTLSNNITFTTAGVITLNNSFHAALNMSNTAVDTAMTTAATTVAADSDVVLANIQLATAQGLAFSKITSIDSSGLITYLGKDGITTNFYNASGAVGVAASVPNAATVQRMAVVTVANPGGLQKAGNTLYSSTVESGVPSTSFSLANNSANGTSEKINTNSLEQSNVDMAGQFVKMIMTQRAYSANSKTITTADEMTQEVLNLKR